MDGHHSHNHSDPDLKVLVIAIFGICAIIFGPAIAAALWIMVLAAGIGMGLAALGLVAVIVHNLRQTPPIRPIRSTPQRKEITPPTQLTADDIAEAIIRKYHEGTGQ